MVGVEEWSGRRRRRRRRRSMGVCSIIYPSGSGVQAKCGRRLRSGCECNV